MEWQRSLGVRAAPTSGTSVLNCCSKSVLSDSLGSGFRVFAGNGRKRARERERDREKKTKKSKWGLLGLEVTEPLSPARS